MIFSICQCLCLTDEGCAEPVLQLPSSITYIFALKIPTQLVSFFRPTCIQSLHHLLSWFTKIMQPLCSEAVQPISCHLERDLKMQNKRLLSYKQSCNVWMVNIAYLGNTQLSSSHFYHFLTIVSIRVGSQDSDPLWSAEVPWYNSKQQLLCQDGILEACEVYF